MKPACVNGHLYSETTCIKRPLRDVPKESAFKDHLSIEATMKVALAWPLNTGLTVSISRTLIYCGPYFSNTSEVFQDLIFHELRAKFIP